MDGVYNVMLFKGVETQDSAFAPVRAVLEENGVELTPVGGLKGVFTISANGAAVDNGRAGAIIDQMMRADREAKIIDGALLVKRQPQV